MIEMVVFDMAGTTLYDGDAVKHSFEAATAHAGIVVNPTSIRHVMGIAKPLAIRMLLTEANKPFTDADVEIIHTDFVRRMCEYYATSPEVREIPHAGEVFQQLRQRGIKVVLNTGFSRPIVEVILHRLGWHVPEVIDDTLCSDEVPQGRPHPDMIHTFMKRFGITNPANVAKVGDTQVDLEEGTNAGCRLVIGVTTGAYTREQLLPYPHTHIVDSVADVPALIR